MDNWDNWILIGTILHHGYTWNKSPSKWSHAGHGHQDGWHVVPVPGQHSESWRVGHILREKCFAFTMIAMPAMPHVPWGKQVSCSHFHIIQLWCFILAIQSNYCWSVGWWFLTYCIYCIWFATLAMTGGSQLTCTYQGCGGHHQPDKHVIYRLFLMTGSLSAQVLPQFYDLRTASHDCVHPLWLPRLDVWSTRSTGCGGVCGQRWVPKDGNILRWNGVLKITQKESPEVLVILVLVGLVVRQLT